MNASESLSLLERYGHHDETCASMYEPSGERPCNCGFLALLSRLDPPAQRYRDALTAGLSDAEAREEGWPTHVVPPPATPELREAAQAVLDAASLSGWYNHAAIIALAVALAETPGEPR